MREIKFRGQRIDNKEWVYGYVWFSLIDGDLTKTEKCTFITFDSMDSIGKVYRNTFEVMTETVGQLTGLYDVNHVEVYDDDKIRYKIGGHWFYGYISFDVNCCSYVVEKSYSLQAIRINGFEVVDKNILESEVE